MRQDILKLLQETVPQIDFTSSETMIDKEEIWDPSSLMTMVSKLSVEYDITIPYDEMIPENFDSLDSIVKLVERLKK